MDDSVKSGARLEVSVSFGRFENDALSWEKWSSFSPNKYLEEVGTLSTPGSVAQKKAYFEAHYKKIAAKKAEELEQETLMETVIPSSDVSSKEDHIANSSENDTEFSLSSFERSVEEAAEDACVTALTNVVIADEETCDGSRSSKEDEQAACTNGKVVDNIAFENKMDASVTVESRSSAIEKVPHVSNRNVGNTELNVSRDALLVVSNSNVDNTKLNVSRDTLLVVAKTPQKDSKRILEGPPQRRNGLKQSSVLKKENSKLNSRNIAQKVTPINKEKNLSGTRTKVVSTPAKPLSASTSRDLKPTSISTPISAPQTLKKKVNNSAPPKIKSSQVGQSKRVAPTSLHMSLSLGPSDSLGALPMTRKSLIMESMGDKDIVKRAFKTFQNRTSGFATDEKPAIVKHVLSTACEPKKSSYHTPTKGNEGLIKDSEKRASSRSQSGTRSNLLSSGLRKSTALSTNKKTPTTLSPATGKKTPTTLSPAVDKRTPTTLSPATALRSDEKAEKRKEFLKKLGAKSIAREAENAKSKVGIENGTRQRQPTMSR